MSMKEHESEASPDLDAGWDELDSLAPPAPAARSSEDDFASIFAVDEGWDDEGPSKPAGATAEPSRVVARGQSIDAAVVPAPAPPKKPAQPIVTSEAPAEHKLQRAAPPKVSERRVTAPARSGEPVRLSKKDRRDLERKGRAHALRSKAERKQRAKLERKERREEKHKQLAEERAKAEAARLAKLEAKKRAPRPEPVAKRETEVQSPDSARRSPKAAQRSSTPAREQKTQSKAERAKARGAADFSPWLFAVAILLIVVVLAWLRR